MLETLQLLTVYGSFAVSVVSRRWSFPILILFLPLMQWFPDTNIPGLNAFNMLFLPVLLRALAAGSPGGQGRRGDPLLIPAVLFIVLTVIAWGRVKFAEFLPARFVDDFGLYRIDILLKEFISCFLLYFCARRLARSPDDMRRAVGAVLGSFMFEMLTGVREFLFTGVWRATGHLANPNRFGAFLSAYMMIPVAALLSGKGRFRWLALGTVGASALGLLGSVSRGALIGTGLAVIFIATLRRSAWIIVFAAVVATAPMWLPEKVIGRFDLAISDSGGEVTIDTEHEGRVEIWRCGASMIRDNPMGVGLEQFPFHLREYGYVGRVLKSSHNIYIQLAAEQGVGATILHVWMLFTLGYVALRLSARNPGSFGAVLGLGLSGVIVSFLATTMFGDGFYETQLSGLFWVFSGLVVNLYKGFGDPDQPIADSTPA